MISYVATEQEWMSGLRAADTPLKLMAHLRAWTPYVKDAWPVVRAMTSRQFEAWRSGLLAQPKDAGLDWNMRYGALLLPKRLLEASLVAMEYCAPLGTALIRLAEQRKARRHGTNRLP